MCAGGAWPSRPPLVPRVSSREDVVAQRSRLQERNCVFVVVICSCVCVVRHNERLLN